MSELTTKLKALAKELRELLPGPGGVEMTTYPDHISIHLLNVPDHATGLELMRKAGFREMSKMPFESNGEQLHSLSHSEDGIYFTFLCKGVPPTCRIVKKTERIPKTQTVETGEFIEVTREVIECGPEPVEIMA